VSPRLNKRAKRLSLRVNPKTSNIELIIPPRANQQAVERFVLANRDWIARRKQTLPAKIAIKHDAIMMFWGVQTLICITPHTKRTTVITHENNGIHIRTSRDDPSSNLKRWVIEQARAHIEPLAYQKALSINKPISKIDLRDTSSRWGSCSSDGRLMLSWRLIFAPPYVLDYVVGHEVAHLKYMDHGKQFWDLCYSLCDEPDKARKWLKANGNQLLSIF
jgi:predicted metal-dependent hydrolase